MKGCRERGAEVDPGAGGWLGEECHGADAGESAPVGAGFAGAGENQAAASGHSNAALGVAGDGEVDDAGGCVEMAFDEGDVGFLYLAIAEGFAELGVGGVVFGNQDDAGRLLVEEVNDARTPARRARDLRLAAQGLL